MKELKAMTAQELEDHKRKLYKDNTENGNIHKLYTIARMLGEDVRHNYGPKYTLRDGGTVIYVDDYGGYMTTSVEGKLKVSTHNEKLYVPGEWEEIITRLFPEAEKRLNELKQTTEDKAKQYLLKQLS